MRVTGTRLYLPPSSWGLLDVALKGIVRSFISTADALRASYEEHRLRRYATFSPAREKRRKKPRMEKASYWIDDQPQTAAELMKNSAAVGSRSNQKSDFDLGSESGPFDPSRTVSITDARHYRKTGAKRPRSAKLLILKGE
jgi:hypothetical protein